MTADAKHTLGAGLMWGGVGAAALGTFAVLPGHPGAGAAVILGATGLSAAGMVLKKRNCPRCRAGACELPPGDG